MGAARAVVCGTGFGERVHVPALRAAGFEVVALVGRDAARTGRRAARSGVPHACTSLADALALGGVQAVTVATPPATHATLVGEALAAGMHVICEKPFALDAAQAQTMRDAAAAAGVGALVGHEFRWAPERATLGRAIAQGLIGAPRLVTLVQVVPLVADPAVRLADWWFDPASGGGWLGASGSHVVDQVRVWLGDEFASLSATLPMVSDRDPTRAADDSFVVRARTVGGVAVILTQTAAGWGPVVGTTAVAGTDGTLWLDGDRVMLADRVGVRPLEVPDDLRLAPAAVSTDARHRFTHLELGPYTRLCEVLARAVAGGPVTSVVPVPTFDDGLAEMLVLDAVRASAAADGAVVAVSAAAPRPPG